jgi:predicted dehydrogenase
MNTSSSNTTSRRDFLKRTAQGAAAVGLASMSRPLLGQEIAGANDQIRIGVIGTGGRGTWGMQTAMQHGAHVAAVCDVYTARLENAASIAKTDPGKYEDHRALLDRDDVDAVIIATPDHWHCQCLKDAVAAGKDVYIEKPLSKTIEEGKEMVKAVRATNQVVQVGNHRRSGEHWVRAREVIQSGVLGKLTWVRVFDTRNWCNNDPFAPPARLDGTINWKRFLGSAPYHEFDMHRYFAWRWYWDYAGGLLTDIGAHQLDVAQWLTDMLGPKTVAANGGNHFFDYWETPDNVHTVLNYGTHTTLFSVQFLNDHDGVGGEFYGSDATLVVDRAGFHVYPQGEGREKAVMEWPAYYEGPAHVKNWLDCIRSREEPNSPIETGHRVITAAHLSNISYREGRRVEWDVETEQEV